MGGKANRAKGHRLERELASFFRDIGFEYCKTSRAASRQYDDCGIDLCHIPVLVQAKSGYDKRYPRFNQIHDYIKGKLATNFPPEHEIHSMPIILVHKSSGRRPQDYTWTVSNDFMRELLGSYYGKLDKHDDENKK